MSNTPTSSITTLQAKILPPKQVPDGQQPIKTDASVQAATDTELGRKPLFGR
jgi:hypothetical protein